MCIRLVHELDYLFKPEGHLDNKIRLENKVRQKN